MTTDAHPTSSSTRPPWARTALGANLLGDDGRLGLTIFEEVTALAQQHSAINLGQGFPDEDGPQEILDAARSAIASGANQYAPGQGLAVLRNAVAAHQSRFHGLEVDPQTEVIVTTGATEGIAASVLAFAGPGDEVLTFEPFYDSYGAVIGLSGATHTTAPLLAPDFQPDPATLEAAFSERTRIIVVNNPHNPTGSVFSRESLELIVRLAERYDALIVTDEVYEHLVFEAKHLPIATLPGARARTLSISSAGKTFSITGWKVGWLSGPADLVAQVRTVKTFLTYTSGTPFQGAVALGLGLPDDFFTTAAATLQKKRDLLGEGLRAAGFEVFTPKGTFFALADAAPLGLDDATDLARRLPALIGIAAIPVAAFCHDDGARRTRSMLRFAFCKKFDVIEEAAHRLAGLRAHL